MTFKCGFCKKSFKKESTLAVHVCEKKRRHMVRDNKDAQLGFRTYQLFYKVGTNSKKEKTYEDYANRFICKIIACAYAYACAFLKKY